MRRGKSIRVRIFGGWRGPSLLGMLLAAPVMPAQAQTSGAIEISGYVAPRCWVVEASPYPWIGGMIVPRGQAICNYAAPMLRSTLRMLTADAVPTSESGSIGTPPHAQLPGRAALEITVSPHL